MVPAPEVCDRAVPPANATRNAVNTNAARVRWEHRFHTLVMGSPNQVLYKVFGQQLHLGKWSAAMPCLKDKPAIRDTNPGDLLFLFVTKRGARGYGNSG